MGLLNAFEWAGLTSKNSLLFLLLINVVLIAAFSFDWETSSAVFARHRVQGLHERGIFSSSRNEGVWIRNATPRTKPLDFPQEPGAHLHSGGIMSWRFLSILCIGVSQCHLGEWLWRICLCEKVDKQAPKSDKHESFYKQDRSPAQHNCTKVGVLPQRVTAASKQLKCIKLPEG